MASGSVENVPRRRLELDDGAFAVMFAVDRELGYAGVKAYTAVAGKAAFVVCLFELQTGTPGSGDRGGRARPAAHRGRERRCREAPRADRRRSLGIIGCGWQAEAQVDAIRAAVPTIERVVAYCRTPGEAARVLLGDGRRAWREPPRRGGAGHRRHGDELPRPRSPWRVAPRGHARVRHGREPSAGAGARQRRARTGDVRLLRLAREGAARVGRPDRARRGAACSTGSRCTSCRRSSPAAAGPAVGRRHRASSSRTGSPRGTWRSAPRWSSGARARGVGREL